MSSPTYVSNQLQITSLTMSSCLSGSTSRFKAGNPRVTKIAAITADRSNRIVDIANMAVVLATDEPGMITGHVYQMDSRDRHFSTALALSVPAKQTTGWFTRRSQMSSGMPNETDLSAERQRRNLAHGYTAWSTAERRRSIEPTAARAVIVGNPE